MNSIHKKEVDCILMSAAAVLALVTVIMGATQKAMTLNVNFSLQLILSLSAAVTVAILRFFANFDFLPLAMSVLLSAGFGMIINEGLPVIVDKINDTEFDESEEMPQYREKLRDLISIKGAEYVHGLLKDVDPAAASRIHPNDHKRMIRALEYHECTGGRISDHNAQNMAKKSAYNLCYFVLTDNRQKIYDRINARVDKMIEDGLVDEVRSLMAEGLTKDNVSMHGIGYKEIIDHLSGNCTFDEAVYRIKRESRHFAKRQLTWFSREKDVIWIDLDKDDDVLDTMINELKKKGIVNG